MSIVTVYAVFANAQEAERIGRQMVEERLASCANIFGLCQSIYRWQDAVQTAEEVPALFKTLDYQAEALMTRIASLHSYDVPCVVIWPIDKLLGSYAEWVEGSVG